MNEQTSFLSETHDNGGRSVKVNSIFDDDDPRAKAPPATPQNYRTEGPNTSKAAGVEVDANGTAGSHRAMILDVLRRSGEGMTSGEIALACLLDRHRVMKRMVELARAGLITRNCSRICTATGARMTEWKSC